MSRPRALENIRVVDFSWVRAGPWATRWLGAFGAEVIKIEWPESERGRLPSTTTPQDVEVNLNTSGNFNDTNVNKKSLSLNVRSAKGLEIVRRLIAVSDLVIENFSSRVLRNWGLGYEALREIKPDIVYVSMSGYGHTGRHHHYTTFGPVAQAASGLTYLSGLPGEPPAGWGWSYMDDTGGMYGAMCALTGLYHRNMTGQGQHIDLSQMVSSVPLNGPALLDFAVNGRGSRRPGLSARQPGALARHPCRQQLPRTDSGAAQCLPHRSRRVQRLVRDRLPLRRGMAASGAGDGRSVMGRLGEIRHGRRTLARQEELDEGIEAWSMTLGKYELTERCQAAGFAPSPCKAPKTGSSMTRSCATGRCICRSSIRRSECAKCRMPRSNSRRPRRKTTCRAR